MRRPEMMAALCAAALLTACGAQGTAPGAPTAGADGPAHAEPLTVTPRAESVRVERTVGTGNRACSLYVEEWSTSAPGCVLSVTHCDRHGACLTCADERRLECGKTVEICGERVRCGCPTGAAEPVADAPGTVVLRADGSGPGFAEPDHSDRCTARPTTLAGASIEDAPCIVAIHECERPGACVDRQEMLSCGVRSEVCGRPVVCRCGEAGPTAAEAARPPPSDPATSPPRPQAADSGDPPCGP